jgi:hypothetical protein
MAKGAVKRKYGFFNWSKNCVIILVVDEVKSIFLEFFDGFIKFSSILYFFFIGIR